MMVTISNKAKEVLDSLLSESQEIGIFEFLEEHHGEGICFSCGEIQHGCEPDASRYECEECSEHQVYGLETALIMHVY